MISTDKFQIRLDRDAHFRHSEPTPSPLGSPSPTPSQSLPRPIRPIGRLRTHIAKVGKPDDGLIRNYNSLTPTHTCGPLTFECPFCHGLFFEDMKVRGSKANPDYGDKCCKGGRVQLPPLRVPPPELRHLMTSDTAPAKQFRASLNQYNNALTLTSTLYKEDTRLQNIQGGQRGQAMFSIQGQLIHKQGPLLEHSQQGGAMYNQLFFYDTEAATSRRKGRFPGADVAILNKLHDELKQVNPFVKKYLTARERLEEQLQQQSGEFRLLWDTSATLVVEKGPRQTSAALQAGAVHPGRLNLPTVDEIAVIIPDHWGKSSCRDIILAQRNEDGNMSRFLHTIDSSHGHYIPLHYVLLFPYGEHSWHYHQQIVAPQDIGMRKDWRIHQRQFARYRLRMRVIPGMPAPGYHHMFYSRRLFQKFICDMFACSDDTNLQWIRAHQPQLRAILTSGLQDTTLRDDMMMADIGKRFILPSSHLGSPRFMNQLYQDSMAIYRRCGKPSLFITFTANPTWPEIVDNLLHGEAAIDRADIVCDVFNLKVKALIKDLRAGVLGEYAGHVCTIEYQKRGLPHLHLCLFLRKEAAALFNDPVHVDQVVSAEFPSPLMDSDGRLRALIGSSMVHGPCEGKACRPLDHPPHGRCVKKFPYPWAESTSLTEANKPEYKRRQNGDTFVKHGSTITNQWVVPYNPYLCLKYQAHINVEVCNSASAIKYIHKYIYKGSDRTTFVLADDGLDEISEHQDGRYVAAMEGYWRTFEYDTHGEVPAVKRLDLHLKRDIVLYLPEHHTVAEARAQAAATLKKSTLTAYFEYNAAHEDGRHLLYQQFPEKYTFHESTTQ